MCHHALGAGISTGRIGSTLLVSTQNEADFGRAGLHYVHFPWAYLPRPDNEMRWYHRIPGLLVAYRNFCRNVARASDAGLRRNISLANSEFVAGRMRDVHGVESKILYPPVAGGFPSVPWEHRVEGIVALGRMHATKRWETAVAIADRVRSQGIDISLTLISHRDDIEFGTRMEALAAVRPWFRILYNLPRDRMVEEVARHRYGIHTMESEHFGIAPAELQRAGCVTFVHRSGGPMEIVARRDELMFDDAAEGLRTASAGWCGMPLPRMNCGASRRNAPRVRFETTILHGTAWIRAGTLIG